MAINFSNVGDLHRPQHVAYIVSNKNYNREIVNNYEGDIDGRVNLIPEQYRFTGTVNIAYHLHLSE